jgi:hypothetical protein
MTPTDAMIEAGDQVLGEYWALKCAARQGAVRRIYTAMESARDPDELREAAQPFADSVVIDPTKKRGDRHWATCGKLTTLDDVLRLQAALSRNRGDVGHG